MKLVLKLLLPLAAMAANPSAGLALQTQDVSALAPFTARELAPGIHLLSTPPDYSGPAISNVTVIEQGDGMVVIDSGATIADGRRIVGYIRSITDKPVKAVMITHWHNDHPLGIAAIRDAWPQARIISTERTRAGLLGPAMTSVGLRPDERFDAQILNQASESIAQVRALEADPAVTAERRARIPAYIRNLESFARDYRGTYLVPPTETFTDQMLVDDAERPVRMMFLGRANTDGDAVAWLPRQRIVITGDIVVAPIPFGFFSYPESWISVLQRLKSLNFALLVPGHGEQQIGAAYLDQLIATITDIRAQVTPLARQNLSLEEVRSRADFSAQSAIFGPTPRLRATFEAYWLTPMVENAYKEARGEPIIQGGGEGDSTPATVRRAPRSERR